MFNSIVYVGMDVHKKSYTLCCYTFADDEVKYKQKIRADYKMILKYIEGVRDRYPKDSTFLCGYEAGCLGYSLYHELTDHDVDCKILAPTTMAVTNNRRVKTDKRDAANIARCLALKTYSEVYVLSEEDNAIKEFIRMRDDQMKMLKSTKQQILAFTLRNGCKFEGGKTHWTIKHKQWLRTLKLDGVFQETLNEYLITYEWLVDKIERLDQRIEELALGEKYEENVKKLSCFIGVKTHTALSFLVEIGDFHRFAKANNFSSFLGLTPGEDTSDERRNGLGITKAGNGHLRKLLTESAQGYTKGQIGYKSKALKARQKGNSSEIIAYADKANERLRRKFYKLTLNNNVNRNKSKSAIARELACFMWGMMTDNIA